jgi:hypothetical protein
MKTYRVTTFGTSRDIHATTEDAAIFKDMVGRGLIRINRLNSYGMFEVMLDPNGVLPTRPTFDVVVKIKE